MADMTADSVAPAKNAMSDFSAAPWPAVRKTLEVLGWLTVALLIYTGLSSIFGRTTFLTAALAVPASEAEASMNAFDIRYFQHYIATILHLGPGFLIFTLGPLQFIPAIRKKYLNFHRWSGRVFLVCGLLGAATGSYIGIIYPFTGLDGPGFNESMATTFIGLYTFYALYKAYSTIRARQIAQHREWMIRAFAIMLGIATERLMLGVLLSTTSVGIEVLFGATFWMAAVVNISAGEVWIRLTRTPGNGLRHWKDADARAAAS